MAHVLYRCAATAARDQELNTDGCVKIYLRSTLDEVDAQDSNSMIFK